MVGLPTTTASAMSSRDTPASPAASSIMRFNSSTTSLCKVASIPGSAWIRVMREITSSP